MSALLGLRFALGARDGRVRTLLVAAAAGAAIGLLLLAVAVPHALQARDLRSSARQPQLLQAADSRGLLWSDVDFTAPAGPVSGGIVAAVGPDRPLPPGVHALPAPGTMLVSPALAADLPHDPLLAARLPYRVAGVLPDAQLLGPGDLRVIAADPRLATDRLAPSVLRFGTGSPPDPLNPVLALLLVIGVLVVLVPIGVVVALAGRFGAERRDRRLAALRLAGLGRRQVAAVLAVEALCGGAAGALVGGAVFLAGRQALAVVQVGSLSVFPADAVPPLPLALLVLAAVPATVVGAALAGLRGVLVEPLGVTRSAGPARRRLRLRLIPLTAGAALLGVAALVGSTSRDLSVPLIGSGVALLLAGAVAVLPWVVERVAAVVPAGAVPWRFARGRLVHGGGSTVRVVGAVAALLAGAIALQMLFAGLSASVATRDDVGGSTAQLALPTQSAAARAAAAIAPLAPATTVRLWAPVRGSRTRQAELVVGSCTALRTIVAIPRCGPGTAVLTDGDSEVRPADVLEFGAARWHVPQQLGHVGVGRDADGATLTGALLVVTGTLPLAGSDGATVTAATTAADLPAVVAAAVRRTPVVWIDAPGSATTAYGRQFDAVRRGLSIGLGLVLLLVGGVLLVSLVDQLRERRAALATLAAIGMRRRSMSASVLWESAVPVLVGAVVATGVGALLGLVLLRLLQREPVADPLIAVDVVLACVVPLAVSAAGLPFATRLMRPEGLRAE